MYKHLSVSILQAVPLARQILNEVKKLLRIYLTIPVTTATAEGSFSALRRMKSYLRSTMTQQRLNNVMLLHVHKLSTDQLNLIDVAEQFIVNCNDRRQKICGHF